jgi:hypothetical protein
VHDLGSTSDVRDRPRAAAGRGEDAETTKEPGVEITIGVQHVSREIALDVDLTADEVSAAVAAALAGKPALELNDSKGRRVIVPTSTLAFVELGAETKARVGFGRP